ncbi:Short-chain dehydrogenase/reductase SDR [Apiospora kogelbergensis]|uniref:Short-chain dehydrogenase/reductase SDR n=1 Tax=Apiospora kogelbergensis TaxID=1337665 RepID=UPI00312D7037
MVKICLNRPDHTVIGSIHTEPSTGVAELQGVAPATGSKLLLAAGIDHVDLVIVNAGGSPLPILPLEEVSMADLVRDFQTNAASHLALFQAFHRLRQRSMNPKWASITSAAGSITIKKWLTVIDINPCHVHSGPGNWLAERLDLDQAPLATVESASAVLNTIDGAVREEVLGKLISSIDGKVMLW